MTTSFPVVSFRWRGGKAQPQNQMKMDTLHVKKIQDIAVVDVIEYLRPDWAICHVTFSYLGRRCYGTLECNPSFPSFASDKVNEVEEC